MLPKNITVDGQPLTTGASCVPIHFTATWTPTDHSSLSMAQLIDRETGDVLVDRVQASTPVLHFFDLKLNHLYRFQVRNYTAHDDPWAIINFRTECATAAPKIVTAPSPQSSCASHPATFSVVASGTVPLQYQWRKDGKDIAGATSRSFHIDQVQVADQGLYSVLVSDCCRDRLSAAVRLAVQLAPTINNPIHADSPLPICQGKTTVLSVQWESATSVHFQWRQEGHDIPGQNGPTLRLSNVTAAAAGKYTVVISNDCGATESQPFPVIVLFPPVLPVLPGSSNLCAGDRMVLRPVSGLTPGATYQWRRNGVAIPGATSDTWIREQVGAGDEGNYTLLVCNECGCVDRVPIVIGISFPPKIDQQPQDLTVIEGDKAVFAVHAVGSSPIRYQWLKSGASILNATGATFTLTAVRRADAGAYAVQVINGCGNETSSVARLVVSARCSISGYVWNDSNTNGVWDRFLSTLNPDIAFVLDRSTSTLEHFGGSPVGDFNHDGTVNSIIDAELAALEVMNNALIRRGLGQSARISLVEFSNSAFVPDMEPGTPGVQLFTTPTTDSDSNGVPDVIDVLRKVRALSGTNFREGLQAANSVFNAMKTPTGNGNLIFLSDGFPNVGGAFVTEVDLLRSKGVSMKAFGVGSGARLADLQKIDAKAQIVTSTDELIGVFDDLSRGNLLSEPSLPGVVIYLDDDNNGKLGVTERYTIADTNGFFCFPNLPSGCYHLRQIAPEGYFEVTPGASGDHEVCVPTSGGDVIQSFGDKAKNRFTFPKIQGSVLEFTYAADVGISWRVDRSVDLVHWSQITNIVGGDYAVTIRDLRNRAEPHVFYRNIRE